MCHEETKGTADLLYIDQRNLKKSKAWWRNVTMALIDCKKLNNMVQQK